MKQLKLSRGIIETQIIKHYTENFDPQSPELDFLLEFKHIEGFFELDFALTYSTSLITIYSDEDISCKCGAFDVDLTFIRLDQNPDAMPLHKKLMAIEENKTEEQDKEAYELRQEEKND